MSPRSGVIVLDKPAGTSSNDALARLKRLIGPVKMGFLGTLDPLATGVLPVFMGKATKLIPLFEGLDKAYRVTIRLGERTDTYDAEGRLLSRMPTDHLDPDRVREAVLGCEGELRQRAPDFSAVKHGGVPAYRLARRGQPVPERWRTVRLWALALESVALPCVTFSLACTAGTYVRSLAHEIGERLGVGAHVTALRRLRCGEPFTLERALTLEAVQAALAVEDWGFLHDPGPWLVDHVPYPVEPEEEAPLRHGKTLPLRGELVPGTKIKALGAGGTLVALGEAVQIGRNGLGFRPMMVLV
jgi:tRNA pseudouridine55 synthase